MGKKDPTTDLWTLPIIGSAGKMSRIDSHDEQDAYETLRDEFMERENAACYTTTSSLAVSCVLVPRPMKRWKQ